MYLTFAHLVPNRDGYIDVGIVAESERTYVTLVTFDRESSSFLILRCTLSSFTATLRTDKGVNPLSALLFTFLFSKNLSISALLLEVAIPASAAEDLMFTDLQPQAPLAQRLMAC